MGKAGFNDRVFEASKLGAVIETVADEGVSPSEVLRGVGVTLDELNSGTVRVSIGQLVAAFRNVLKLSSDPSLPFKIGANIHLSAYGMYGYALFCCTDFRRMMEFAVRYHVLAAPIAEIVFSEEKGCAIWTMEPIVHRSIDRQLYRFMAEMQMGVHISLQRDVMGPDFAPREIWLGYAAGSDFHLTEELVGCPIRYRQPTNRMFFDGAWLDAKPRLGNRNTFASVAALCDQLLSDMTVRTGLAGRIRGLLMQDIADRPDFDTTAMQLGVNGRTLRRQLLAEGTSFRALWDELRTEMAIKYLRETAMTNEDVAFALGFSDAANFRQAFRRWTGKTPGQYRPGAVSVSQ